MSNFLLSGGMLHHFCIKTHIPGRGKLLLLIEEAVRNAARCLISLTNNLNKLLRMTAWYIRYFRNKYFKKKESPFFLSPYLHAHELAFAEVVWTRRTQRAHFRDGSVFPSSQLASLNSFFDSQSKCLRVGERLRFSKLSFKKKHPVILPSEAR